METTRVVEIEQDRIVVRFDKRNHTTVLREASLDQPSRKIPWLRNFPSDFQYLEEGERLKILIYAKSNDTNRKPAGWEVVNCLPRRTGYQPASLGRIVGFYISMARGGACASLRQ